ncbi:MAG: hypothetical protein GY814_03735, partial [Gammaproteobacteria bacterium]|nr:hypothetical protein [Gammaproteobacteria bacterium]
LKNSSELTHTTGSTDKLHLIITDKLLIDAGSKIDVSNRGNKPSSEVGRFSGGSYGGYGGIYSNYTTNAPYGDYLAPYELGMGGRRKSSDVTRGGGAIKIIANVLELSGQILANGQAYSYYGTGSGGSIWLDVGTLKGDIDGTARIMANGGGTSSDYGTGSGGRIAIYYSTLDDFDIISQVYATSAKSTYAQSGAAGTVYSK